MCHEPVEVRGHPLVSVFTFNLRAVLESTCKGSIWWCGIFDILRTETTNFSRKGQTVNTFSSQPRWSLSQLLGSNSHKKQAQTTCKQECGPEFVIPVFYLWKNMLPTWKYSSEIPSARKKGPPHFSWLNNSVWMVWMINVSYSLTCLNIWSPAGGTVWKGGRSTSLKAGL